MRAGMDDDALVMPRNGAVTSILLLAMPRDGAVSPILLLSLAAVLACAATPPNVTHTPVVNISFIKEVTLSVSPEDIDLTPHEEQEISSFLESGLRLLDPIMRFFDGLVGSWRPPPPAEPVHV